eukprot:SAG22_NODE_939_length_6404_cov_3.836003_5_plen_280_part_00
MTPLPAGDTQRRRRLRRLGDHLQSSSGAAPAASSHPAPSCPSSQSQVGPRTVDFPDSGGSQQRAAVTVTLEAPLLAFGARLSGIDLSESLTPGQAGFIIDCFHEHKVLCVAGQDIGPGGAFSLAKFERFANHIGAPLPHPNRASRLRERPCLQVQSNVVGYWRPGLRAGDRRFSDGWHTDIDYETVPSNATIFLCHSAPDAAAAGGGGGQTGATSFLDTAAFYESLPAELRRRCDSITATRQPNDLDDATFGAAPAKRNVSPLVRCVCSTVQLSQGSTD